MRSFHVFSTIFFCWFRTPKAACRCAPLFPVPPAPPAHFPLHSPTNPMLLRLLLLLLLSAFVFASTRRIAIAYYGARVNPPTMSLLHVHFAPNIFYFRRQNVAFMMNIIIFLREQPSAYFLSLTVTFAPFCFVFPDDCRAQSPRCRN